MKILVTGGCGYIGSHCVVNLLQRGYEIVVLDDLSNSAVPTVQRIEEITNKKLYFYEGDVRDESLLLKIFEQHEISAVIHLAGKKSVNDSFRVPEIYYSVNLNGTIALTSAMAKANVKTLLFSSSAVVYGNQSSKPAKETDEIFLPLSPYGRTKYMAEIFLMDMARADPEWRVGLLRYFNPMGCHPSGLIGEKSIYKADNLLPVLLAVASRETEEFLLFGEDYETRDGSCVRDFIHVCDLAEGHVFAFDFLLKGGMGGINVWNLGSGTGFTVKEVLDAFSQCVNKTIRVRSVPKRSGDIAVSVADITKAKTELGWMPMRSLDEMLSSAWVHYCRHLKSNLSIQ